MTKRKFTITATRIPLGEGGGWDFAIEPHVHYFHMDGENFHQAFVALANTWGIELEKHLDKCKICRRTQSQGQKR